MKLHDFGYDMFNSIMSHMEYEEDIKNFLFTCRHIVSSLQVSSHEFVKKRYLQTDKVRKLKKTKEILEKDEFKEDTELYINNQIEFDKILNHIEIVVENISDFIHIEIEELCSNKILKFTYSAENQNLNAEWNDNEELVYYFKTPNVNQYFKRNYNFGYIFKERKLIINFLDGVRSFEVNDLNFPFVIRLKNKGWCSTIHDEYHPPTKEFKFSYNKLKTFEIYDKLSFIQQNNNDVEIKGKLLAKSIRRKQEIGSVKYNNYNLSTYGFNQIFSNKVSIYNYKLKALFRILKHTYTVLKDYYLFLYEDYIFVYNLFENKLIYEKVQDKSSEFNFYYEYNNEDLTIYYENRFERHAFKFYDVNILQKPFNATCIAIYNYNYFGETINAPYISLYDYFHEKY